MRKIISIILALVVVICICESAPIKIVANAEEKINLWDGYIPISTKEDLNNIRYADFDNGQPKYYLTNDICFTEEDFSKGGAFYNNGEGWEPIPYFSGVFDGNGHNIVGLKINGNNNNVSDFGEIACIEFNDGIIKNLGFSECSLNVSATSFSFGFSLIVCTNYGTISNCYVDSKSIVKILAYNLSEISFGAISNYNFGIIENCFNKAKITVKMEEKEFVEGNAGLIVGGITAFNYSKVSNCYNHGDIYCKTLFSIYNLPIDERGQYTTFSIIEFAISGIVGVQGSYDTAGFSESVTSNCYNKGNIDLKMKDTFGQESFILSDTLPACDVSGIVARNSSGIVNCSNEGRIIVAQERTIPSISVCIGSHRTTLGGISGSNSGNIIGCYNNGGLSLWQIWNGFQGGIVGVNDKGAIIEKMSESSASILFSNESEIKTKINNNFIV